MFSHLYKFIKQNLLDIRTYKWFVSGLIAFSCDYFLYINLIKYIQIDISKSLGVMFGIFISYNLNRRWTFKSKNNISYEAKKFLMLYGFNLILNVGINHIAYRFTKDITISYFTALFITVSIGFIGQKYWVFKKLSN
tara:strand:+ start:3883 stop:4293 length:411 start_codon:yes stop_codon:yes gene_type:complete